MMGHQKSKDSIINIIRIIFIISAVTSANNIMASTLTKSNVVNGAVTISWTCTGTYCILQSSTNNSAPQTITTTNSSGSYNATVVVGITYTFTLKTYTAGGASGPVHTETDIVTVTPTATPSVPAAPTQLTTPSSDIDGRFPIKWSSVSGATSYVLELSSNGGGWTQIYSGSELVFPAAFQPGSHSVRVKACVNASICSAFKTSNAINISGSQPKTARRVVFVHTDLLGSPAAETNEQGNENE